MTKDIRDIFREKQFDVEHALLMYAYSFVNFPAFALYNKEAMAGISNVAERCHIYLVGQAPIIDFLGFKKSDLELTMEFSALNQKFELKRKLETDFSIVKYGDTFHLELEDGKKIVPNMEAVFAAIKSERNVFDFEVLYVGQAFGNEGSRNALDRLQKHETLQKISVLGVPEGYALNLVLLEIQPASNVMTIFNPWAKDQTATEQRISNGSQKLFNTTEQERTTLYEAALIRYFEPRFNKEFKSSFPSTRLNVLKDCYAKDFAAVVAEI